MSGYGLGITGAPGPGVTQPGTLQRHAVPVPWLAGTPHGYAVCGQVAVLTWIWGQPLPYSLKDSRLCVTCAMVVKGARK